MKRYVLLSVVYLVGFLTTPNLNAQKLADFSEVVEKLLPVVVEVRGESKVKNNPIMGGPGAPMSPEELLFRFFGQRGGAPMPMPQQRPHKKSLGSGFIIGSDVVKEGGKQKNKYYVVTNNHVIADTDEVTIILNSGSEEDKVKIKGKIKGQDPRTDIALIEFISDKKLPVAKWGDSSKTKVGSWSIAIGNPLGLGSTVTAGVISYVNRDISADGLVGGYIQTDTAINMGNSGGPLFNLDGGVIGINTSIVNPAIGSGIAFAIPSNVAKDVVEQLIKYGKTKRGWLGILMQEINEEIADSLGLKKKQGALVVEVIEKSPAKGKLKQDDVILEINGKSVRGTRDIQQIVSKAPTGKPASITVLRKGKKLTVKVKIAEYEKAADSGVVSDDGVVKKLFDEYGIKVSVITQALRNQLGIPKNIKGVLIKEIMPEILFKLGGAIRPGDVIVSAGNTDVSTPSDVYKAFKGDEKLKRHNTLLKVYRSGQVRYIAFPIALLKK